MSKARNKLVEKAATAVSRGKYKRALEAYQELEQLEPSAGAWSRRSGEMLRHLDRKADAVEAFARSVEAYASSGFLVKAIAVCKLILRIDAGDVRAQEKLKELTDERFSKPERRAFTPVAQRAQRPPRKRTIPPGHAIEEVTLRDAVPGASPVDGEKKITLIPIDEGPLIDVGTVNSEMTAALRATELFEGLAAADLNLLLDGVILRELAPGETVFRQGDIGGELYIIDEGEVRVLGENSSGATVELGRLKEGDFFGEVALVANTPRTATIEATAHTELLVLSRTAIAALVEQEPSVLTLLLRFVRDRLFARLTSSHELLASFSPQERSELASRFELLEVEEGASIIVEGQGSKTLYVVLAGKLSVTRGGRLLASLIPGDVTGEMSLLTQEPAIATVSAATKVLIVRLPGAEFRQLIMTHPQVLAYIGELVDTRKRLLSDFESGSASFESLNVDWV